MIRLALILTLLAGAAHAQFWGSQCEPAANKCLGSGTQAQNQLAMITGAGGYASGIVPNGQVGAVRFRIVVEHPITDVASGLTCVSQDDLDPATPASGGNYTIKLVNSCAGNFNSGGGTATSDFWGGNTATYTKSGLTITVDQAPRLTIYGSSNYVMLGAGNPVALAQSAGLHIDFTWFNAGSANSASDDLIRDQNGLACTTDACNLDFRNNVAYTWRDILATGPCVSCVWTVGNEETGSNQVTVNEGAGQTRIAAAGSGYTAGTPVVVSGGGGSGVRAIAIVSGGVVQSIDVGDNGSGFTQLPTATIGGTCAGVVLVPVLNPVSGSISKITVSNGGSGCANGSVLQLSNGGEIGVASVSSGGIVTWEYGAYPMFPQYGIGAVTQSSVANGGTGATFTFSLNNNGDFSGNETTTYNPAELQQKMTQVATVGHSLSIKVGDSGFQGNYVYLGYWYSLFYSTSSYPGAYPGECGTLACQQTATGLTQTWFSKNVNQQDFGANLPNSCGGGSITNGQIARINKMHQLIAADLAAGLDFQVFHWYQVVPYSTGVALAWLATQNGHLPLYLNEVGEYGNSYADAINIVSGCKYFGAVECIWWNRNGGASQRAQLYLYLNATLNPNGHALSDALSGVVTLSAPKALAPELPLC